MSLLPGHGGIFISYRREETAAYAGRLYDRLSDRFGEERVFMDVDSIAIGVDFARAVIDAVSRCDILLALIGREWSSVTDSNGKRRIDNPDDFVRVEIETALQRDIRVVPVLVEAAILPQADDLPPSLRALTRRQALELSHAGFRSEVTRLVAAVDQVLEADANRSTEAPKTSPLEEQQSPQLTDTSRGSQWTAHVLASTPSTRTLRISLSNDVHIITVRIRPWYDTIELNSRIILRKGELGGSYSFVIDDGGRRLAAEVSVAQSPLLGQKITKISLVVMGLLLYEE
jgi:hypothetical protein